MPLFEILDKGGLDQLMASIGPELKVPGRRALGIVVDANDDIEARWAAVTDRFRRTGVEVGDRDPQGTVIRAASPDPDVGVWIMPENKSAGELEDFIAAMIPRDDPVWPLSREYVDGIPPTNRLFRPRKALRAKVHAWLAARDRPRPMGLAIGAGDLDVGAEVCVELTEWLLRLFR